MQEEERGTGSLGVGATMASALDGCIEGVHLRALRMSAGYLHRWGQDFWDTMEVTGLGGLWEEWALSVLFLCFPTSHHSPCGPIRTEAAMLGGPRQGGRAGWSWV